MEEELGFRFRVLEVTGNLAGTRDVVEETGLEAPVLLDCRSWARGVLHIAGTPSTIVIDADGRVRAHLLGVSEDLPAVVAGVLRRIGGTLQGDE
ncbi:MAG: hypothetical protein JW876_04235 [Candidatus Krumholzibacteriota bacterium]|nr:hypothetical protein [Candidatus Krumholzibacteriota bacterium]